MKTTTRKMALFNANESMILIDSSTKESMMTSNYQPSRRYKIWSTFDPLMALVNDYYINHRLYNSSRLHAAPLCRLFPCIYIFFLTGGLRTHKPNKGWVTLYSLMNNYQTDSSFFLRGAVFQWINEYHAVDQPQVKQSTPFATLHHLKAQARNNTFKCRTYRREHEREKVKGCGCSTA